MLQYAIDAVCYAIQGVTLAALFTPLWLGLRVMLSDFIENMSDPARHYRRAKSAVYVYRQGD